MMATYRRCRLESGMKWRKQYNKGKRSRFRLAKSERIQEIGGRAISRCTIVQMDNKKAVWDVCLVFAASRLHPRFIKA